MPPASCDEQNIKLHDYFVRVTSNCLRWGKPVSYDEQNIKLRYYLFRVYILILGSVSPASSDEQKHYAACLFLSLEIQLLEVVYPIVPANKTFSNEPILQIWWDLRAKPISLSTSWRRNYDP